jgi:hypothetical protein
MAASGRTPLSQDPPAVRPDSKQAETAVKGTPFHWAAALYLKAGWSPFPLPHKKKSPPPTGYTGYAGAYVTTDDAARWNKAGGGNVGLRMPECVIGIDVDAYDGKSGGATFAEAEARLGALPPTWRSTARETDLVSGIRYFRVPVGRQWADRLGDAVEVIHHGHRYAVAAPSVHPSGGVYGWFDPDGLPVVDVIPDVSELPELPAAWVNELDRGDVGERPAKAPVKESDVGNWLEGLRAGDSCPPVLDVLDGAEKAFCKGSRHDAARGLVLRLVRLGEQGHTGTLAALDTLEAIWLNSLDDREPGWGEWERMVSGGVGVVLGDPTPDAKKGCCVPDDEDGKKPPLSVQLRQHVAGNYDAFPAGGDGRIFVQSKQGGRAELLTTNFVLRAAGTIGNRAANLSGPAKEAATQLTALALHEAPRELALRAHYQPGRIVLDLAQTNSTQCVVVTPKGWEVRDVPPGDVVFQTSGAPLPTPRRGGDVDELRSLLRWQPDDARWLLVKGWLPCTLLSNLPRPALCLFGPQGSAKSTTGRLLTGVIDPKPAGVLGGGFGKNRGDDETKALKHYVPAWDNVSTLSDEGADFVSRMVTGDLIEKRQLYTDAELVSISYRRTAVITGINMPRGVKPDTLDRLILLALQRIEGERLPEGKLEAEWNEAQPRVLAGVLDLAVRMLAGLPTARNPADLRMADYAEAVWAIDSDLYGAYADNVTTARGDMANDDPFIRVLVAWLRDCGGEWEGTADEAQQAAMVRAELDGAWWPRSGRSLSEQLNKCSELLRAVGVTVETRRSNGDRLKRFVLVEE